MQYCRRPELVCWYLLASELLCGDTWLLHHTRGVKASKPTSPRSPNNRANGKSPGSVGEKSVGVRLGGSSSSLIVAAAKGGRASLGGLGSVGKPAPTKQPSSGSSCRFEEPHLAGLSADPLAAATDHTADLASPERTQTNQRTETRRRSSLMARLGNQVAPENSVISQLMRLTNLVTGQPPDAAPAQPPSHLGSPPVRRSEIGASKWAMLRNNETATATAADRKSEGATSEALRQLVQNEKSKGKAGGCRSNSVMAGVGRAGLALATVKHKPGEDGSQIVQLDLDRQSTWAAPTRAPSQPKPDLGYNYGAAAVPPQPASKGSGSNRRKDSGDKRVGKGKKNGPDGSAPFLYAPSSPPPAMTGPVAARAASPSGEVSSPGLPPLSPRGEGDALPSSSSRPTLPPRLFPKGSGVDGSCSARSSDGGGASAPPRVSRNWFGQEVTEGAAADMSAPLRGLTSFIMQASNRDLPEEALALAGTPEARGGARAPPTLDA